MEELQLYNFAIQYLRERLDEDTLDHYLNLYRNNSLTSLNQTFEKILESIQERRGMPNSIGSLDPLRALFYDFSPKVVLNNFDNWQNIFTHIQNNHVPPGRMDINNGKNYWVIFSKGIFSTAVFLARFDTVDEFKAYCNSFLHGSADLKIAFPLLLAEEIHGLGFALACNFLKEWVSPYFVKPDTHTKDIFIWTKFAQHSDSDFSICRRMIKFSESIDQVPFSVDKTFWLIGSGKLHKTYLRPDIQSFKTSKKEFVRLYSSS